MNQKAAYIKKKFHAKKISDQALGVTIYLFFTTVLSRPLKFMWKT